MHQDFMGDAPRSFHGWSTSSWPQGHETPRSFAAGLGAPGQSVTPWGKDQVLGSKLAGPGCQVKSTAPHFTGSTHTPTEGSTHTPWLSPVPPLCPQMYLGACLASESRAGGCAKCRTSCLQVSSEACGWTWHCPPCHTPRPGDMASLGLTGLGEPHHRAAAGSCPAPLHSVTARLWDAVTCLIFIGVPLPRVN